MGDPRHDTAGSGTAGRASREDKQSVPNCHGGPRTHVYKLRVAAQYRAKQYVALAPYIMFPIPHHSEEETSCVIRTILKTTARISLPADSSPASSLVRCSGRASL